jgi:hypothetical protein
MNKRKKKKNDTRVWEDMSVIAALERQRWRQEN